VRSHVSDYGNTKNNAIFVFADSRDYLSEKFDDDPPIYFSHNDFVWSAAHDNVLLGMGKKVVETLYRELTHGKELNTIAFGKPQLGTFEFATCLLQQRRKDGYCINRAPETILRGRFPESDIRGTNQFNANSKNEWYPIIVRTGVFKEGPLLAYKPMATVDTVLDAVKHGMKREFQQKDESGYKEPCLAGFRN
jgi:ribonucleotide monophosphatase NagD (HAD superfamily)